MIPTLGPAKSTAYAMKVSCFMVIIQYLVTNSLEVLQQPWQVYAQGFGMAMISSIISSFFISEEIKRLSASNFAIYRGAGPISTILLAIIFFGERLDIYQFIGMVVVIIGVSIVNVNGNQN